MTNVDDLHRETNLFFNRHWHREDISPPKWKMTEHPYEATSFPYHSKGGCYALSNNNEILYIGIGNSLGHKQYEGHGIIRRLLSHVLVADKSISKSGTRKVREKWRGVSAIWTIGFDMDDEYLANSLEEYLIRKLPTKHNTKSKR